MSTLEKKKKERFQVLEKLYKDSDADSTCFFMYDDICKELGIEEKNWNPILQYLEGEGLVESRSFQDVSISHAGIKEIEEVHSRPDKPTEHFLPMNLVYVQNMHGSQVQVGTTNSSQSMTTTNTTQITEALKDLLLNIEQEKCEPNLKEAVKANIKVLTSQANLPSEYRDRTLMQDAWTYIGNASSLLSVGEFILKHSDKILALIGN